MANHLTLSRLVLSPAFAVLFLLGTGYLGGLTATAALAAQLGALGVAIWFEASDILDGIIARKTGKVSDFGKLMDPLADRVSRLTVFFCFFCVHFSGFAPLLLIFYREALVEALRSLAVSRGVVLAARGSGKIKVIIQGTVSITVCSMVVVDNVFARGWDVEGISRQLMWVVALTTLWSLADYLWHGRQWIKELMAEW